MYHIFLWIVLKSLSCYINLLTDWFGLFSKLLAYHTTVVLLPKIFFLVQWFNILPFSSIISYIMYSLLNILFTYQNSILTVSAKNRPDQTENTRITAIKIFLYRCWDMLNFVECFYCLLCTWQLIGATIRQCLRDILQGTWVLVVCPSVLRSINSLSSNIQ